ncbi:helix-turn-helix domain-containing protein [Streptosporangium sandarakinum]|uniref:Transcriptional regulator with XRE-family HTH domain n=1 Tax=Streptosporangium sandarakinum TaxID=1260955 RepID=A0A852V4I6_9ACTN|nr:helix-turn-helix domain-containing protein [Streptosporangium sandarakinum]NYF44642.1 transcriptional regulator with XRE-family HTH domain [Streptosporangium sandarakinum]
MAERLGEALRANKLSARGVERALKRQGMTVSHAYISQLKKGEKTNPTLELLEALAALLGVQVGWLAGEDPPAPRPLTEEERRQQEAVKQELTELGVLNIAERMTGLSPLSISAIAQMVEAMRAAEALDETP